MDQDYNEYIEILDDNSVDLIVSRLGLYPPQLLTSQDAGRIVSGQTVDQEFPQVRQKSLEIRYEPLVRILKPGGFIITLYGRLETPMQLNKDEMAAFGLRLVSGERESYPGIKGAESILVLRVYQKIDTRAELRSAGPETSVLSVRLENLGHLGWKDEAVQGLLDQAGKRLAGL